MNKLNEIQYNSVFPVGGDKKPHNATNGTITPLQT